MFCISWYVKLFVNEFNSNIYVCYFLKLLHKCNFCSFKYLNDEICLTDCLVQYGTKSFHIIISWKNTTYFKSKTANQPTMHAWGLKFSAYFLFLQSHVLSLPPLCPLLLIELIYSFILHIKVHTFHCISALFKIYFVNI